MNGLHRYCFFAIFLAAFCCFMNGAGASAQEVAPDTPQVQTSPQQAVAEVPPATAQEKILTNYVEAGGSYYELSNGYGCWSGGYARGVVTSGRNTWSAEVNGEHEFGDAGTYLAAGDTLDLNSAWYGSLAIGSSVGGIFWPRLRVDGFINKKNMERKQWVTTLGVGYYESKDVHRDQSVYLGSTYYFQKPWIVESGIRFNLSNPGAVFSPSGFVAVTQGQNKHQYITVRAGYGVEAYQIVGPTSVLEDFTSRTLTVTWRRWLGKSFGFNLVADYYRNPYYERGGSSAGFFKEF